MASTDPQPAHHLLSLIQIAFQAAKYKRWGSIKSDSEEPELWFWNDDLKRMFRVTCSQVDGEIDSPAWTYARYMLNPKEARDVAAQEANE